MQTALKKLKKITDKIQLKMLN